MLRVEEMRVSDFSFAVKLANSMNWHMTKEDFEFNRKLEPHGCYVLFANGEQVGIATCINFGEVGWFGNLVVEEKYRGKGAGSLLVNHAINYLKSKGAETIGLYAYPHLTKFYQNLGFKPDAELLVLSKQEHKEVTVSPIPESSAKLVRKAEIEDTSALVNFDRECFGASREKLLKEILFKENNKCYLSMSSGKIVGYVMAKVYEGLIEVGPLACHKNHTDTGVMLIQTVFSKLKNCDIYTYVPSESKALLNFLLKTGFSEDFRLVRMFLGSKVAANCLYMAESLERG